MNYELMEGVQVLSEGVCEGSIVSGIIFFVLSMILFVVSIHAILESIITKSHKGYTMTFILILLLSLSGLFVNVKIINDAPVQYKVIINDNVTLNEFNEMYRIITQEGRIYTINER